MKGIPAGLDADRFQVTVNEDGVTCREPDGHVTQVTWPALRRVTLVTTDQSPAVCDLFWMLEGEMLCLVPQGTPGEEALLPRLQQLPGFNNEAVIAANCSIELAEFVCWEREATDI